MDKVKRVYILGAGASIGHIKSMNIDGVDYPTINDFFKIAKGEKILETYLQDQVEKLNQFLFQYFSKDLNDRRFSIDIEEVMTYLQIEFEKSNSAEVSNHRDLIMRLIVDVLGRPSKHIENSGKTGEYHFLRDMLNDKQRFWDTIITFNWDLLLDEMIGRREHIVDNWLVVKPSRNRNPRYDNTLTLTGRFGRGWNNPDHRSPYNQNNYNKFDSLGYYIKLHGSIDWVYCFNESCKSYGVVYPISDYLTQHYCFECREEVKTLIIPPVLNKQFTFYPFIRKLWNIAGSELSNADEIIIWGYSLPPTDFYSNWLMRRNRCEKLKKLILINPDCVTKTKGKVQGLNYKFIRKFYDIYKPSLKLKDDLKLYEYFKDYKYNNDILKKYGIHQSFEKI